MTKPGDNRYRLAYPERVAAREKRAELFRAPQGSRRQPSGPTPQYDGSLVHNDWGPSAGGVVMKQHAHPTPVRMAHPERVEVTGSRYELLLFVAGIFAALLVLSVVPVS